MEHLIISVLTCRLGYGETLPPIINFWFKIQIWVQGDCMSLSGLVALALKRAIAQYHTTPGRQGCAKCLKMLGYEV